MFILAHYKAFGDSKSFGAGLPDLPKTATITEQLGHVFRQLNAVDGSEWIADKPHRSISVGDEVTLMGPRRFRVEGCGWSELAGAGRWVPVDGNSPRAAY